MDFGPIQGDFQWFVSLLSFTTIAREIFSSKLIGSTKICNISDDKTNVHITELLKNVIKQEIDGLRKCGDCYANAHADQANWFTMVCNEPHIVAWATLKGCSFWPVKIMSANGRKLSVRFFGDHTHADVPAAKCYLFSEDSPAGKGAKSRGGLYQTACQVCHFFDCVPCMYGCVMCVYMPCSIHYIKLKSIPFQILIHKKEANVYIDNIKKKFGTFIHAPFKTVIEPERLAQYTLQMIPGTGISPHSSDLNAMDNSDERAEVTSSSNDSGTSSGTGTSSTNSSVATTMDSSVNSQKSVESHSPDPKSVDTEVQPAKKARLSAAAANNDECIPMDQKNEHNENAVQLGTAVTGSTETSPVLLEQVQAENVDLGNQLKQMSDLLNEKGFEVERLKHDHQALIDENNQLKRALEEAPRKIDRTALVELAKSTKICVGCNAERPSDMLHFCGVVCQKTYL